MAERRSRRRPGENSQRLLRAGTRVFALYGYHGAGTAVIAQLADVPQPHVYANFRSKAALFVSCVELACDAARETAGPHRSAAQLRAPDSTIGSRATSSKQFSSEMHLPLEQAALIIQAFCAAQDSELKEQLSPLLRDLRATLGESGIEALFSASLNLLAPGGSD